MRAFVADAEESWKTGKVHVVSLPEGRIVDSLPTLHNPDVAVSPDGRSLYVVQTNLEVDVRDPTRDELVIYDTRTLAPQRKLTFTWRSLYNVIPAGPSLVFSSDGRFCHVNRTETLGDDAANNTMLAYDVDAGSFREQAITLPYQVTSYGPLPNLGGMFYALSGRLGEAVAFADPLKMAAAAADANEPLVWVVSRPGLVLVWDVADNRMSEPIHLELPEESIVPLQAVLTTAEELLIGVSPREAASRGLAQLIFAYQMSRGGLLLRACWPLDPRAERLALSPDKRELAALSRSQRMLAVYDIATGELRVRVEDLGTAPVSVAFAADSG
jgi:hypothetical protein